MGRGTCGRPRILVGFKYAFAKEKLLLAKLKINLAFLRCKIFTELDQNMVIRKATLGFY
jgi:hypothetical protein